jgi:hypothetical protein
MTEASTQDLLRCTNVTVVSFLVTFPAVRLVDASDGCLQTAEQGPELNLFLASFYINGITLPRSRF